MTRHVTLGPGAEFDAIRTLLAGWGERAIGIGDDGAVLDVPRGSRLIVSTDSTVEDVHFRTDWITPQEIGWRATTAALSDLAAMGAAPLGVLLALTVPGAWRASLGALADGIGAAVAAHGVPIVGGDVTDGDRLALAVTVLGHTATPLMRSGARAGDTLYVTGTLGGPGAALAAWVTGRVPSPDARARFAHPEARIAAGQWLAAHGAHAAIDISDGLGGDAGHVAAASHLRCVIDADAVPRLAGTSARDLLVSGEEYELLVAAPSLDVAAFRAACDGLVLTAIGRFTALAPGGASEVVAESRGERIAMARAHDHFAKRAS